MERGTVSMRVAFVLRSAEVQPLFLDLCDVTALKTLSIDIVNPPPPYYTLNKSQTKPPSS